MIDINQDFSAPVIKGRIRMAYSLNGTQPVLCTLLCDQPLYYMEEEIFEDEGSALFMEEEMVNAALGADIGSVQKKISIYDSVAKKFAAAPGARVSQFIDNTGSFGAPRALTLALESLLAEFSQSRYGESLLAAAQTCGTDIVFSDQVRAAAFDAQANLILINPVQTNGDALLMLAHALRQLVQKNIGAGAHPLSYHPDDAILVNRALAADLAATQVRVAWELQLAGANDAWARLEQTQGSDLARAFAREALCDFRTLGNGKAARAVFESWFLSDRCKIADRELIQAMLADQEAKHFSGDTSVTPLFLSALGEQTLGKNYLGEMAGMILSDPVFSEVRDRSNANFLWFVKFERSFKETEETLKTDDGADADETIHSFDPPIIHPLFSAGARKNDTKSAASESAPYSAESYRQARALEDGSNQTNIVYVSFGSAR